MKYKYEDANIADVNEAVRRILNGEKLYFGRELIVIDFHDCPYPVTFPETSGNTLRSLEWLSSATHKLQTRKEVEWFDDLGDGVLCWVWDIDFKKNAGMYRKHLALVCSYNNNYKYKFGTNIAVYWHNAMPATKEEIGKYIYGSDE